MSVLVIVFILALTATLGYMAPLPAVRSTQASVTLEKMEILKEAVGKYTLHMGAQPASLDFLVNAQNPACSVNPTTKQLQNWCGPYIDRPVRQMPNDFKTDAWGTEFQKTPTTLRSCGANFICGDSDDIVMSL